MSVTVIGASLFLFLVLVGADLHGITVEKDGEVCTKMCKANYSEVLEECEFGCSHRTGIRQHINPFDVCFDACETRFKKNLGSLHNDSNWVNTAWEGCLAACQLPYKTNFKWNVYVDLRSGEPIWNFERILNDGPKTRSVGVRFDDLVNSISVHQMPLLPDPSIRFGSFRLQRPASDEQVMQTIMLEMLHRVRMEMSKIAPNRFDGFTSIHYIGPRIVETGPHGPIITDITELEYRPNEVLIYNSRETHRDRKIFVIYFLLFSFLCTVVCALVHLRRYHETLQKIRIRRAELARQRLMDHEIENGLWAKRIPMGTAPPSYSSPEEDKE